MQNSKDAVHKQSRFEKRLNRLIVLLFLVQVAFCVLAGVFGGVAVRRTCATTRPTSRGRTTADAPNTGFLSFWCLSSCSTRSFP